MKRGDKELLDRLLYLLNNRAGRRPVIKKDEDKLIKQRLIFAASRGFALDLPAMKHILVHIAADGPPGFRTVSGLPNDHAMQAWRARNRDITYKKAENETFTNIHVRTCKQVCRSSEGSFR